MVDISMQDMRYLNLFSKISRVNTRHCFKYNEIIFFGVPKLLLSKAIGEKGVNIKKISEVLKKRVRIIALPKGIEDIEIFIKGIINPVEFKELEVKEYEIIITAGSQNKAALLGRNKRRLMEMQKIVKDYFGKELKII